jgi:hypothetical protein
MKRLLGLLVVLALVVAACGDDDAADAGSLDSCESIADAGIAMIQDVIDEIDDMTLEEQIALGSSEEEPQMFQDMEARGEELETRAEEVGCSDEQMAELVVDRLSDLSSDSDFGQLVLETVKAQAEDGELFGS